MLVIDADLPPGALLPEPQAPVPAALDLGGLRYGPHGTAAAYLATLVPMPEGPMAVAVAGNDGGCPAASFGATRFLTLATGRRCGFGTEAPIAMGAVSLAVVFWAPEGDARTLAALCEPEGRNYLHLTVREGVAEFAYRDGAGRVVLDAPEAAERPVLLMASAVGETLTLGSDSRAPATASAPAFGPAPRTLFIGCRRFREGLRNSLGAARIADVVLYPDRDLFGAGSDDLRARLLAHLKTLRDGL